MSKGLRMQLVGNRENESRWFYGLFLRINFWELYTTRWWVNGFFANHGKDHHCTKLEPVTLLWFIFCCLFEVQSRKWKGRTQLCLPLFHLLFCPIEVVVSRCRVASSAMRCTNEPGQGRTKVTLIQCCHDWDSDKLFGGMKCKNWYGRRILRGAWRL